MPTPNPEAMRFLLTRRSRPAKILTTPVPSRDELMPILTAAGRVPDHGKLEPWRFIVLTGGALTRLARAVEVAGAAEERDADQIAKAASAFDDANLVVAVVSVPRSTEKVPAIEQTLSGGAACAALVNAALASGWGACWLTGWALDNDAFKSELGLEPGESVLGFVHIGTETAEPPERPRPDIDAITTWLSE